MCGAWRRRGLLDFEIDTRAYGRQLVLTLKPDDTPYRNDGKNWGCFLDAAQNARWLDSKAFCSRRSNSKWLRRRSTPNKCANSGCHRPRSRKRALRLPLVRSPRRPRTEGDRRSGAATPRCARRIVRDALDRCHDHALTDWVRRAGQAKAEAALAEQIDEAALANLTVAPRKRPRASGTVLKRSTARSRRVNEELVGAGSGRAPTGGVAGPAGARLWP
jgi:hypothetical protein